MSELDRFLQQYAEKEGELRSSFEGCTETSQWTKKMNPSKVSEKTTTPNSIEIVTADSACTDESDKSKFQPMQSESRTVQLCTKKFSCSPKEKNKFSFGGAYLEKGNYWLRCKTLDGADARNPCDTVNLKNCSSHSYQNIVHTLNPIKSGVQATPNPNVNHGVKTNSVNTEN